MSASSNPQMEAAVAMDQLFTIEDQPTEPVPVPATQQPLDGAAKDKVEQAQTMLEAHEACVEANPENAAKFKDVLEYLKQDLHLAR